MADSGITFRSQQFGLQAQQEANRYQLAGAQALGDAIANAPLRYMQAQEHQMKMAGAASELEMAELRKQELVQKIQMTGQIRALDQQRIERDLMDVQLQERRLALKEREQASGGSLEMDEYLKLMVHDPLVVGYEDDGTPLIASGYEPVQGSKFGKIRTKKAGSEDLARIQRREARSRAATDPKVKMQLDTLEQEADAITKGSGLAGVAPDSEEAKRLRAIQRKKRELAGLDPDEEEPQAQPAPQSGQQGAQAGPQRSDVRPLMQSLATSGAIGVRLAPVFASEEAGMGVLRVMANRAQTLIERGYSQERAMRLVAWDAQNNAQSATGVLIESGVDDESAIRYLMHVWELSEEQAKRIVRITRKSADEKAGIGGENK